MNNYPEGDDDRFIRLNNILRQASNDGYDISDHNDCGNWFEGTDDEREAKVAELLDSFDWAVEDFLINTWIESGAFHRLSRWDWSSKAHKRAIQLDIELTAPMWLLSRFRSVND